MFNIFIACLCVPMLSIPFFMHVFRFRFIDIHVFTWSQIYCHFLYVTCHCLYLYAWATSLDHGHVWLLEHANWLHHMYSRVASTTLDSHVQILQSGPWRLCCSWSEWRSRSVQLPIWTLLLRASSWPAHEILILLLVSTLLYFILYILLLCFMVILYSWDIISCLVIIVYLCYYCWNVYYHCASVLWFLHVLMFSVYT